MHWSKQFVTIILFAVCVLVTKTSSANRVENNSKWLKMNFKRFGIKENQDISKRVRAVEGNTKKQPKQFNVKSDKSKLNSVLLATNSRWNDHALFNIRPRSETENRSDGIKSPGTDKLISKTRELNYPEIQQPDLATDKNGAKEMKLPSSYILNRQPSKLQTTNDIKSTYFEDEENLGHTLNRKKRSYDEMVSGHRILKRDVNTSLPTQPSVTQSTSPPIIILSPPPLPPKPSFNSQPVCSGQKSCSGRCTVNVTEWRTDETLQCYCDTACYEIFNDCCTDYTIYCGVQKPSNILIKKFNWTCEPLGHFRSDQQCVIGEGLWMVSRCADDWPDDEIRRKCENPTKSLRQSSDISRYIPAKSGNFTFRNYFCAKCNRIAEDFQYFPVEIKTNVIPPEHYNFSQKVNFLLLNGAEFPQNGPTRPKTSQTRRYCFKSIVDSCLGNTTSESCTNGPATPVSGFAKQFKNYDCALCDNPNSQYSCFPSAFLLNCRATLPQKFVLNLDYKDTKNEEHSIFTVLNTSCRNGLTYDDKLQECVENLSPPTKNEDKFLLMAWFSPAKDFYFTENDFKTVMKRYFGVEDSQIYNISIEINPLIFQLDPTPGSSILYHLVRSTFILTPEKSFDIFFKTDNNSSIFNLGSFIHFEKPLSVTLNNITYTIIKTTSRPLSCITQNVYGPHEYDVLDDQRIHITSTKITYKKSEYYRQLNGNITICEVYSPSSCEKTQTGLTNNDFIINSNLSLYQKNTGMLYKRGQYDVLNDSIVLCDLELSDIPTCSSEHSCKDRCSNQTQWRTEVKIRCSCDPDCYEVFNDCCSDYIEYCRAQNPTQALTKKYNYTCESVGHYDADRCSLGDGLWMVIRCRPEWPYDTFRAKCEAPVDKLTYSSPDLHDYLPVLGHDNITFRNSYCAICNGIKTYEPWPLDIQTSVIPPENYNITDKIRFLLSVGAEFPEKRGPWRPGANQARRYCVNDIIDSCPSGKKMPSCNNGNVAVVSFGEYAHLKNTHCAACHDLQSEQLACFPVGLQKTCEVQSFSPQSFSLVLDNSLAETETRVSVYDEKCGKSGLIFDDILQVCRVNWLSPPEKNGQERFYVYAWLQPPRNSQNNSFTPAEFQDSLAKYLNVSHQQLFDVNITTVLQSHTKILLFYLVSSTIAITPQQSLELLSVNQNENTNAFQTTKLLHFIYFSEAFTLQIRGLPYIVAKTTSRPLACVGKTTYTPKEYSLQDQERVFIPSSNKTYEQFEYYRENVERLEVKRSSITVCEKYIATKCDGSIVLYATEEYIITVDLSILVTKTSTLYNYGEYELFSNKSVAICEKFMVHFITKARQTIRNNEALRYITFIFFVISILLLIFLLVTYILFAQLRTLPGKNLMNFAASLLLFKIFWLSSSFSEVRSDRAACMAMAIMEHYFLMASFVSKSVIAFHTCKVFARELPAPKMSKGQERKLFCTYLALVWLLSGIFVAICVVLDDQDVVKLGYGESEICWFTENNAYTYSFTIPVAILLLFNIIAFVTTAVYLRKHCQNTAARQASGNRRSNLSIYVKLSTLMGFTWLFGLLALVAKSTTVFWYFFVIFTSLQGVFVAAAFVLNAKTFGLYRKGYRKYHSGSGTPNTTRKHKTMINDAKL